MERAQPLQETAEMLHRAGRELAERGAISSSALGEVERIEQDLASLAAQPKLPRGRHVDDKGDEVALSRETDRNLWRAGLERIIDENDLLPVSFLEQGVRVQRSVARIVLTAAHDGFAAGTGWATGFLVSPSLFLTNNHAIEEPGFLPKIRLQFNYQLGPDGVERESDSYEASRFIATDEPLDYTLIRLRPKHFADDPQLGTGLFEPGERWGFVPFNLSPIFRANQSFNIVQHPDGRRKEIALQNNRIHRLFEKVVLYKSDTEPGSSGSPVFDNLWQLVALHHAGGDRENGQWINNEGVRIDRIAEDLRTKLAGTSDDVLDDLGI